MSVALAAIDQCENCHTSIVHQWRQSLHAHSMGPGVIGQFELFDNETVSECLSCHAPSLVEDADEISIQDNNHATIDCIACHDEVSRGHALTKSTKEVDYKVCIYCHQFGEDGILVNGKPLENTLEEWKSSKYSNHGINCITCHMPGGSHRIKGIHDENMTRSALNVSVTRTEQGVEVSLFNKGAGHALPTYITPRIRVLWKNSKNSEITLIALIQRRTSWDESSGWSEIEDSRLMPMETRKIFHKPDENSTGHIEVWVDPDADYHERVYPDILKAMLESNVSNASIKLIQQAKNISGKSSYLLYSFYCGQPDEQCR